MATTKKTGKYFGIIVRSCLAFVLFIGLMNIACDNVNSKLTANNSESILLQTGQTVIINNEPLYIKFAEVISDSRCPTGVQCFWQGEVSCRLEITYRDTNYTKIITQPGLTEDFGRAPFVDYEIKYKVSPYPQSSGQITKNEYRLQIEVNKKP